MYSITIERKHKQYRYNREYLLTLEKKLIGLAQAVCKKSYNTLIRQQTIQLAKQISQYIKHQSNIKNLNKKSDLYLATVVRTVCQKEKNFLSIFSKQFDYQNKTTQNLDHTLIKLIFLDFDNKQVRQNFLTNFKYFKQAAYVMKLESEYYYLNHCEQNPQKLQANYQNQNYPYKASRVNSNRRYLGNDASKVYPSQNNNSRTNNLNQQIKNIQNFKTALSTIEANEQASRKLQISEVKSCKITNLKDYFPKEYQFSKWSLNSSKLCFLYPKIVQCFFCLTKKSQFNFLNYNYKNYCDTCLVNPKVKSSNIPSDQIKKILKYLKIDTQKINIHCTQCQAKIVLHEYDVGQKPTVIKCQACQKNVA